MNIRGIVFAVLSTGLLADANAVDPLVRISWWVGDPSIPHYVTVVDERASPDLFGNCSVQHTSLPQPDANLELDARVSLTASGGLLMQAWALHGNDAYPMALLMLTAIERFAATASGTLPPNLALQINMRVQGTVFVAERHEGLCGVEHSSWATFNILIRDSQNQTVAQWLSPLYPGAPTITLVAETDDNCLNPIYWAVDRIATPPLPILAYDSGCGAGVCPDGDLNALDYYVPFNGAYAEVAESPSLLLPHFQPGETYNFIVGVRDVMSGTGALDFWNTIEFDDPPFVVGTIADDGSFVPLPPEEQAKLTLESATGAMRQANAAVDVAPASCPNPVNTSSKGLVTAAVLGSDRLDVTQIDPVSIRLNGAPPLRWAIEDVGTPSESRAGTADCNACNDDGPDGYADLVLKFSTQELVAAIADAADGTCVKAWVTGALAEEYGGQPVQGFDVVRVLRKK